MRRIIPYIVTLLVFIVMDAVWLKLTAGFYRSQLGDLLAPQVRWLPAVCFYLLQILGIQIFVLPRAANAGRALLFGAGFGIFTYATYDLTNLSVIGKFTYSLAVTDIAWGAVVTATASLAGYFSVRMLHRQ